MNLTVQIPDGIATRLTAEGGDLSQRALEALAAEEYKRARITRPELQRILGTDTSFQLDAFLKAHDAWDLHTPEDEEREARRLEIFNQDFSMFGSRADAALLDEVVSTAYEERHRPTKPVPAL
ncbi:MAG TPA: hypothetical protein VME43_19570 [Bryobacteraceae bacterium]|nr:hypothetical protein [Bryobacteraceae bacterium]